MGIVASGYPKFIERNGKQVLVLTEEAEFDLENQAEKDKMVAELKEMGKDVDMRSHKGASGLGSLKAYYEAVMSRKSDGDSD
jgi:hypothetical protein